MDGAAMMKKPHKMAISINGPLLCDDFRPPTAAGAAFARPTAWTRSRFILSHHSWINIRKCCDRGKFGRRPGGDNRLTIIAGAH